MTKSYKCFKCKTLTTVYEVHASKKYCHSCFNDKLKIIQENKEWDDLYQYVRSEIMKYSQDMPLSSQMVLRLKGLVAGQKSFNPKQLNNCAYIYNQVLLAFKGKYIQIHNAFNSVVFKNEMHKFNYMIKIVEPFINDVVLRLEKLSEINNTIDEMKVDILTFENHYIAKNKETKLNDICKDLW